MECLFFFVSAADGTNVVKMFKEAIRLGWKHKTETPEEDIITQMQNLLDEADDKPAGGYRAAAK